MCPISPVFPGSSRFLPVFPGFYFTNQASEAKEGPVPKKSSQTAENGSPLELQLLPVQHAWLDILVKEGCYGGNSKQAIIVGWMGQQFRELIKVGVLPSAGELATRSTVESKIVKMGGAEEDFRTQVDNHPTQGTTP